MMFARVIFLAAAFIAACQAQAITISGTVKNSAGTGMEGVAVVLGKAAIKTKTGSNGSFTIKENGATALHHLPQLAVGNDRPFFLENDRLFFYGMRQSDIKVTVFDCNGKLLFAYTKFVSDGNYAMALPHFGSSIQIYRVSINNKPYVFKCAAAGAIERASSPLNPVSGLVKLAKTTEAFDDALLFIKPGYQLSRIVVKNPDTAGVQVTMTPLDTGSATDGDGNAYRTVRIGSQYWTAENLRSTKYNDGSSIGSNYAFYTGVSTPADQRKWGALYSQTAAKTGKLGMKGWHVPTNAEWDTLHNYLVKNGYNYDGTTTGSKIGKALAATTDWNASPEIGAIGNDLSLNNASGFTGLPGGWRYWGNNQFQNQKIQAYWWTGSQKDGTYTCVADLWSINSDIEMTYYTLIMASVRLVKDK
jgi:uncharacterized protein (TIGR02145 family)